MNAHLPAEHLKHCRYVFIGFAGGMCEVPHLTASTIVVNDLHLDLINCAEALRHPRIGPVFLKNLRRKTFHDYDLRAAQKYLADNPSARGLEKAEAYYVACWMTRSEAAGTGNEYDGNLCLRYDAGGGDSAKRYHNSIRSAANVFRKSFQRCSFSNRCVFDCLTVKPLALKDDPESGGYFDAPWPKDGDKYQHYFDEGKQRRLAYLLGQYRQATIVVRYGDHPLIRELYPEDRWEIHETTSRTQANKAKAELLIVNRR